MILSRPLALLALIALAACSKPLPPDKISYAGSWSGGPTRLSISREGAVNYQRSEPGRTVSIQAPLQSFDSAGFTIGALGLNTHFQVSEPPSHRQGRWSMVVDGVRLTRFEAP